ncbi:MAG: hypothetical protein K2L80_05635, partial [Muribaculaceae bacterium]|nr:hypothetical protein [Muribaculaceae bacterium]
LMPVELWGRHVVNISRASELKALLADPDADINIVADIDASNIEINSDGPVFRGTINGNGHMISNLRINATGESAGLYGRMEGATVSDLILSDAVFTLDTPSASASGVLCGEADGCTFTNVRIYYTTAVSDSFAGCFGVIAGRMSDCTVNMSSSSGAEIQLPGAIAAGGITGMMSGDTRISACASDGRILAGSCAGGIAGASADKSGAIVNCHSYCYLSANHTVGGIIGHSRRTDIRNCLVDGTVAVSPGHDAYGPAAGGVAGRLDFAPEIYDYPFVSGVSVIYNNIVELTSFEVSGPDRVEEFRRQFDTAHRIVGATVDNEPPLVIGTAPDGSPEYDGRRITENALSRNYAASFLPPLDPGIAPAAVSTEGMSRSADEFDNAFLQQLGFRFGESLTYPWIAPADNHGMRLFYERKAVNIACDTEQLTLVEGESAEVTFTVTGCTADWLEISSRHAYALEIMYIEYSGRKATVHVYARMECDTELTASADGVSASCRVNALSGVDDIHAECDSALCFDGRSVNSTVSGSDVVVYAADGRIVAQGRESVAVVSLPPGLYVAACGNARLRFRR